MFDDIPDSSSPIHDILAKVMLENRSVKEKCKKKYHTFAFKLPDRHLFCPNFFVFGSVSNFLVYYNLPS